MYVLFIYINILFTELRQRGRFTGFSLHVSTTDGNQSPSLWHKDEHKLITFGDMNLAFLLSCVRFSLKVTYLAE